MTMPFVETTRALTHDRRAGTLVIWLGAVLCLTAWSVWFTLGHVTLYETSSRARLEVAAQPHHLAAPLAGRIASTAAVIGLDVEAGQVLIELDSSGDRFRLAEEETRLAGVPPKIAAMRAELAELRRAREEDLRAFQAAIEAARARIREADAATRFARTNESRMRRQSQAGGVSEMDALRARADADKAAATKDAMISDGSRLELERQTRSSEHQARIENLQRSIVALEGDADTMRASIASIRAAIERHAVRSPIAGRIGDVASLSAGTYVAEGQRLTSVVPEGVLKIVGDFDPATAVGRVRPGQRATMRLDGFPWAQFGTIDATVSRVASEIRENAIRVEFALTAGNPAILLQHGSPGVIEIALENATPAELVLRAAGSLLLTAPVRNGALRGGGAP